MVDGVVTAVTNLSIDRTASACLADAVNADASCAAAVVTSISNNRSAFVVADAVAAAVAGIAIPGCRWNRQRGARGSNVGKVIPNMLLLWR